MYSHDIFSLFDLYGINKNIFFTNQTKEFGRIKQKNNLTQLKLLIWQVQAETIFRANREHTMQGDSCK